MRSCASADCLRSASFASLTGGTVPLAMSWWWDSSWWGSSGSSSSWWSSAPYSESHRGKGKGTGKKASGGLPPGPAGIPTTIPNPIPSLSVGHAANADQRALQIRRDMSREEYGLLGPSQQHPEWFRFVRNLSDWSKKLMSTVIGQDAADEQLENPEPEHRRHRSFSCGRKM